MKVTVVRGPKEVTAVVEDNEGRWVEIPARNVSVFTHGPYGEEDTKPTGVDIAFLTDDIRFMEQDESETT